MAENIVMQGGTGGSPAAIRERLTALKIFTRAQVDTLVDNAAKLPNEDPLLSRRAAGILRGEFAPAIKSGGKTLKGVPGVDTHGSVISKAGLTQTAVDSADEGFLSKTKGKFFNRNVLRKLTGGVVGDSFDLFDPKKLEKFAGTIKKGSLFGAGALGGLVAPQIFEMINRGGLFQQEQFGPEA